MYYLKDHRQSEVLPFDTPELINLLPKADPFLVSVFQGADVPDIVKQPRTCMHTHIPTYRPTLFSLLASPEMLCVGGHRFILHSNTNSGREQVTSAIATCASV